MSTDTSKVALLSGDAPKRGPGRPKGSTSHEILPDPVVTSHKGAMAMGHWSPSDYHRRIRHRLKGYWEGPRYKVFVQSVKDLIAELAAEGAGKPVAQQRLDQKHRERNRRTTTPGSP